MIGSKALPIDTFDAGNDVFGSNSFTGLGLGKLPLKRQPFGFFDHDRDHRPADNVSQGEVDGRVLARRSLALDFVNDALLRKQLVREGVGQFVRRGRC